MDGFLEAWKYHFTPILHTFFVIFFGVFFPAYLFIGSISVKGSRFTQKEKEKRTKAEQLGFVLDIVANANADCAEKASSAECGFDVWNLCLKK